MSVAFTPRDIGRLKINNRFVNSATAENMAEESGRVTEKLLERYRLLAKGEVGLIITGAMYVHPVGRVNRYQTGIHTDDMIPGLTELAKTIHDHGGRVVFQIAHSGGQRPREAAAERPIAPSSWRRDPVYLVKPREMSEDDILETICAFADASMRAKKAGADGVQLHCAHGVLLNQFLSPFYNRRSDKWGASDEGRFRLVKEIVSGIKGTAGLPVLVKINSNDYTPQQGITPGLAAKYSGWLVESGVDSVEVSCGTGSYSNMNIWRGRVPVRELVRGLPLWKKPIGRIMLQRMVGVYDFQEGYNLEAAKAIGSEIGETPLILVGGIRRLSFAEEILEKGRADFVSMSRPLIREPNLVKKFREGVSLEASCVNCNKCLAASVNGEPVRCYCRSG